MSSIDAEISDFLKEIPIVSFWDTVRCQGDVTPSRTERQQSLVKGGGENDHAQCNATVASLAENAVCKQASPAFAAESVSFLGPTLLCQKPPWETLGQVVKPAAIRMQNVCSLEQNCGANGPENLSEDDSEEKRPANKKVESILEADSKRDIGPRGNNKQMLVLRSQHGNRNAPPPKRDIGVRPSPSEKVQAMVPMLRARHMHFLDEQYLNDLDACALAVGGRRRASRSSSGLKSRRAVSNPPFVIHRAQANEEAKYSVMEYLGQSVGHNSNKGSRLVGPNVVKPIVKGRMKLQTEIAQREPHGEARDTNLKEHIRTRSSCGLRPKSQARKNKAALNH